MVECSFDLDILFKSLGDPTRRDILSRIREKGMTVGEIAQQYKVTLGAVAKHLDVLERAKLVRKTRQGKETIVTIEPDALAAASDFLDEYRQLWETRIDSLHSYLKSTR